MPTRTLVHTTETGVKLYSCGPADGQVYNEIFKDNVYLPALEALSVLPYTGLRTVVDLGANVGFFTFYVINCLRHARQSHRIYAVEPYLPSAQEFVDRLTSHDNLLTSSVRVANGLAGAREGSEVLRVPHVGYEDYLVEHHSCITTAPCLRNMQENHQVNIGYEYTTGQLVPYINLDTFLPEGQIDLLKVDIEGSEELLFKTYPDLLRRTKILAVEFHPVTCDVAKCKQYLEEAGFERTPVNKEQALEFYVRN